MFRFAPFSSDLFRFVFRTNQNKSGKPLSADPFCKSPILTPVSTAPFCQPLSSRFALHGLRVLENSLTKVLTKMHTGVYTKISKEMPTKVEDFCIKCTTGPHEGSHNSAHGKFDSAHENVHESVLGQCSHVLFSHVFPDPPFHAFFPKKRGLAQRSAVSLLFYPFPRFFGPKKPPFPCFRIFHPRFFRQNCAFFTPQVPCHNEKSMGRIDTKKAQETKNTERGIRVVCRTKTMVVPWQQVVSTQQFGERLAHVLGLEDAMAVHYHSNQIFLNRPSNEYWDF